MKNIVIDARLYGPKNTGIGRYTKNLLLALSKNTDFNKFSFTLIIHKDSEAQIKKDLGDNFKYVVVNFSHYSFKEQLLLPVLLYRLKADLVHFTHFNKPILYFGNSIVTIHDLIKHFFKGKETTTKDPFLYWVKHFSYLLLTNIIIKTNDLIVPSNFWKEYITKNFKINSKKITTIYEAVDPKFLPINKTFVTKPESYILYTGNLYPHKNISIIFDALKNIPDIKLKIICARSYFSQKIENQIKNNGFKKQVEFLGYIKDQDFEKLYKKAIALVHPSLMEGFSLTGLEAMALNCPVISSNSSCLPEIYGNSVLYFNPYDSKDLTNQINKLNQSLDLRKKLIELGHKQVCLYSWQKTAQKTLEVYRNNLK